MNIGAHVRGGGKLVPSLEAGVEIGATSVQIFTQSPRMWKPSQYAPEVLANYREAQATHPSITDTFCHATYLINLASPDPALYQKSVDCLISNLSVGRGMASSGVVLHVGSHLGAGFETVVAQIAEALQRALDTADQAPPGVNDCPILIENAAGSGGTVGRSLDEIQAIIDACGGDERIGLCIDTQHLWASGVDYSTIAGTNALVKEIDDRIGLERLRCFHLNDSKIELGGNRDRHANIDEGTIGTKGLAPLVGHPQIRDLPLLLEVPGSGDGPRAEDVIAARKVVEVGIKLYDGSAKSATAPKKGTTKETTIMEHDNEGEIQTTKEAASDAFSDTIEAVKDFASNEIAVVKREVPKQVAAVKEVAAKELAMVKEELPKKIAAVKKTATTKIAAVKKSAAKKKTAAKKTAAKKKSVVKKTAVKKSSAAKKTASKKATAAKKTVAKKSSAAKTSASKKSAAVKKSVKSAAKKTSAAKKSAVKKSRAATKTVAKKTGAAKKTAAKKATAAKKSVAKKSGAAKKSASKKSAAVKRSASKKVAGAKKAVKKNAVRR